MNIFPWNFIWNQKFFIQENALENDAYEKVAILSRPQCVNTKGALINNYLHIVSVGTLL